MENDIDREDEHRKMIALHAAMGAGRQLQELMADTAPAPEPPKSTGKSRMAAVVAKRAAVWDKYRAKKALSDE